MTFLTEYNKRNIFKPEKNKYQILFSLEEIKTNNLKITPS